MTFRDEYVPRNEPDAGELVDRATVIAHEMAHMWFGDLVTMKWWQDTWLNESFADFMGYHVAHEAGVIGSWPDFSLNRKPGGYNADARRSTHRIAEDAELLVDVDTAFTNFDMITYAKGASVLRQLVTWLGLGHVPGRHERLPDATPLRQRRPRRLPRGARLRHRSRRPRRGPRPTCGRTGFDTIRVTGATAAYRSWSARGRDLTGSPWPPSTAPGSVRRSWWTWATSRSLLPGTRRGLR